MVSESVFEMPELLDDNGYPTEAALRRVREFHGTPLEMIEFISTIWWSSALLAPEPVIGDSTMGIMPVEGRMWFWELHTGGWSGNEDIISELEQTMFWFLFWHQSTRGGHYAFRIGEPMAHEVGEWGNMRREK